MVLAGALPASPECSSHADADSREFSFQSIESHMQGESSICILSSPMLDGQAGTPTLAMASRERMGGSDDHR